MGKVMQSGDNSKDPCWKTVRKEQKVLPKMKKRKKDLIDPLQRLRNPSKRDRKPTHRQGNFVKLLHRFADVREEYGKETKTDGQLGKVRNSKNVANRILPKRMSGIYRNGAVGKEIRRSNARVPLNGSDKARLEGNVMKLLQGYDDNAKSVVLNDNGDETQVVVVDYVSRDTLRPTPPGTDLLSPVFGKVNGKEQRNKDDRGGQEGPSNYVDFSHLLRGKTKVVNTEQLQDSAIKRYEELCDAISKKFEGLNLPDQSIPDPLSTVKKELRGFYAKSSQNHYSRDISKYGNPLAERIVGSSSDYSNPILAEAVYSSSGIGESSNPGVTDLRSLALFSGPGEISGKPNVTFNAKTYSNPYSNLIETFVDTLDYQNVNKETTKPIDSQANQETFLSLSPNVREKKKGAPLSRFLFDSTLLSISANKVDDKREHHARSMDSESVANRTSLEVNCSSSLEDNHKSVDDYIASRTNKQLILPQSVVEILKESINKRYFIKSKNQRTQTTDLLNNRTKRHPGKSNVKAAQQVNAKNLKHIPAILRRCNKTNISHSSVERLYKIPSNPNVSSIPLDLIPETSKNSDGYASSSDTDTINVPTCVIASPSLRKDREKPPDSDDDQRSHVNNFFSKKNKSKPTIQRTVMFTKKDSRRKRPEINDPMPERPADSFTVNRVRQEVPQQLEKKCENCQRATMNSYRSFVCSDNSNDSNYYSQELKEVSIPQVRPVQVQQEPVVCEKLFVRKLPQHPVCFVAADPGKQAQDCAKVEKVYCRNDNTDVRIVQGFQNLKLLPIEGQKSKFKNQRVSNTVVVEEPPIKYLAFDNDSKTQRVPIYVQSKQLPQFTAVNNADIVNPKVNYRLVSYPDPTQKILLVPSHEEDKFVYVEEKDLNRPGVSYERVTQPRKMFLCQNILPDTQSDVQCLESMPNAREVHISKQDLTEIAEAGYEAVAGLQMNRGESVRGSVGNWEEVRHRPSHEHAIFKETCARNHSTYYRK
ncbi:uncharacterized protein LOC144472941 [Augochlora pura]